MEKDIKLIRKKNSLEFIDKLFFIIAAILFLVALERHTVAAEWALFASLILYGCTQAALLRLYGRALALFTSGNLTPYRFEQAGFRVKHEPQQPKIMSRSMKGLVSVRVRIISKQMGVIIALGGLTALLHHLRTGTESSLYLLLLFPFIIKVMILFQTNTEIRYRNIGSEEHAQTENLNNK